MWTNKNKALQRLPVDLVHDDINPLVEFGDVHLAGLESGLSGLLLALQMLIFSSGFSSLSSFHSLVVGLLHLLHVVAERLELFKDALELGLGHLGNLHGLNVLSLLHAQLPAQLVQLLRVMRGYLDVGHEVLVQFFDGYLVVEADVHNHLDGFSTLSAA